MASAPPPPIGNAKTLNSNSLPNSEVLRSLGESCLIVGTLSLPTFSDNLSSPDFRWHHNCFSFSDDSASVCCDVLDFDVRMVGKKILVLSWNFIPLKNHGGFLEIIKWSFPASSTDSPNDCSGAKHAFPLVLGSVKYRNDVQKARHCVYGLLESVSPISVVPCTIGTDQNDSSGSTKSFCGFIVQILACMCKLCCSNDISAISNDFIPSHNKHFFCKVSFVYFVGLASSSHPAILKLVGNVILLSRLKKKLIYMGKEDKEIMFVTTDETCLHFPRLHCTGLPLERSAMEDRSSFGVYTGVVRGIYVQGMVVELDEDVWLLLTDQLLTPPHSIRIGAVVTVRNVHFVNPKFLWRKVLVLGACNKTSISVASFSPLETGCHQFLQSQSLLGKYIGSLSFPARLWVLLIVQCFRTKFVGAFSEKEILGSKHKEGIAQKYASSILSTAVIHPSECGVFMQFCKHDSCGCSRELSCPALNLVVPLIIFVKNCEMMWKKYLMNIVDSNSLVSPISGEHESHGPKIRKIFPIEGSGVSLLGNLQVSPSTGRLQLIDATCSIDVVVPDLPASWNMNDIFEVIDYTIVIEGDPGRICYLKMVDKDAFSCRNIFQRKLSEADKGLDIYVFFLSKNSIRRITPVSSDKSNDVELNSGTFHLFLLTHKFPIRPKIPGDLLISSGAGLYAEAVVLPWDIYIVMNENAVLATRVPVEKKKRCCNEDDFPNKRCNIDCVSSLVQTTGSASNCGGLEMRSCNDTHDSPMPQSKSRMNQKLTRATSFEIPCSVTVRCAQGPSSRGFGILYSTKTNVEASSGCLASGMKVLLEFNAETILKYKLLKIGAYYVIKHCGKEPFCNLQAINYEHKVVIESDMHFWSISFSTEVDVSNVDLSHDHSSDYRLAVDDSHENKKLFFQSSINSYHDSFADVNLWIYSEAIQLFNSNIKFLKEGESKSLLLLNGISSFCEPVGSRSTTLGLEQCSGSLNSGGLLPEGNLVTVCGTVVALHWAESGATSENHCHMGVGPVHQPRSYQKGRGAICLHILTGIHIVKINGFLCKVDYPLGLGLGSDATFHRILEVSGKNNLILTPVSFITVNYVNEFKRGYADHCFNLLPVLYPCGSMALTSLQSIYDTIQQSENNIGKFCCKVVAVHTVILDGSSDMYQLLRENHLRLTSWSIPIAGFIIDDGLQPCCCWADGERAAKILRLHEKMPPISHKRSWYEPEGLEKDEVYSNTRLRLNKILDKHQTITVKNYGSFFDSLCQDIELYGGSDYVINPSDEEILKFIILNACSGTLWSVRGYKVDSSIVKKIEKYLKVDQPMLHSMPNVWAIETGEVNLLAEARDIVQSF